MSCGIAPELVHRLFGGGRGSCFGPEEAELVGIVLDLLVDADAGRVSAGEAVVEQNGTAAGRSGLEKCGHFAGVKRVDAGVAVAGEEHDGGIGGAGLYVVVGRVFEQVEELVGSSAEPYSVVQCGP